VRIETRLWELAYRAGNVQERLDRIGRLINDRYSVTRLSAPRRSGSNAIIVKILVVSYFGGKISRDTSAASKADREGTATRPLPQQNQGFFAPSRRDEGRRAKRLSPSN
jgi:hypothetical protein